MSIRIRFGVLAILSMMTLAAAGAFAADEPASVAPAAAGSETILHSFCSRPNCADGAAPATTLIADTAGNLYGTTQSGGTNSAGTVFRLEPGPTGWKERVLYNFCSLSSCADGWAPTAGLSMDSSGNLYGTTSHGGVVCPFDQSQQCGVVFELHEAKGAWTESVLHAFGAGPNSFDGFFPIGGVILDASGNVFGATVEGGDPTVCADGCGVVYELSPLSGGWQETILHYFALSGSTDGIAPSSGVVADAVGNLYGETEACTSSSSCQGIAYELSASGRTETILYRFRGRLDGGNPMGGLILDSAGNIYGTTYSGGARKLGTVFRLAGQTESVLHSFSGPPDGRYPEAGLTIDSSDNLYGTTFGGGTSTACSNGCGTVFALSTSGGRELWRHSFNLKNGANPLASLLLSGGILYGTASSSSKDGTAYSIAP